MVLRYEDATRGQKALGIALVGLQAAYLRAGIEMSRRQACQEMEMLERLAGVPDAILVMVAEQIEDLARHRLRRWLRYAQVKQMVDAALAMHGELTALRKLKHLHGRRKQLITRPTRTGKIKITRPTR